MYLQVDHILPKRDTRQHIESGDCACVPATMEGSGGVVIIHNSFNGRDYLGKIVNVLTKTQD